MFAVLVIGVREVVVFGCFVRNVVMMEMKKAIRRLPGNLYERY